MKEILNNSVSGEATVTATTGKVVVKVNDEIANLTLDEFWKEEIAIPEEHFNERDWEMWVYDTSFCIVEYIDDEEIVDDMIDKMGWVEPEISKIYEIDGDANWRSEYRYEIVGCNFHPDTKMSVIINEIYNKLMNEYIGKKGCVDKVA